MTHVAARAGTPPTRRVVLLGASNLTLGIGTVLDAVQASWRQPAAIFTTMGHGRSYGRSTRVLGRQLPGILQSGLWSALQAAPPGETAALITDIGNDLLYEEPVDRIAQWVETCLDRLAAERAQMVVTRLPIENISTLSPHRFRVLRKILFPHNTLSLGEIARRARQLNERVEQMATERGCAVVGHRASWYGVDPIHIKRGHRRLAWQEILESWTKSPPLDLKSRGAFLRMVQLCARAPHERRLFGFVQRGRQPAARLAGGSTISLY